VAARCEPYWEVPAEPGIESTMRKAYRSVEKKGVLFGYQHVKYILSLPIKYCFDPIAFSPKTGKVLTTSGLRKTQKPYSPKARTPLTPPGFLFYDVFESILPHGLPTWTLRYCHGPASSVPLRVNCQDQGLIIKNDSFPRDDLEGAMAAYHIGN